MKSKNFVIFSVIVFIAALGFVIFSKGKTNEGEAKVPTQSTSVLNALEKDFDFGTIVMKDGDVSKIFELENEGTEPILISKVYTSCMCTVAKITTAKSETSGPYGMSGHNGGTSRTGIEVGAGETVKVEAIFNPAAHGPSGVGLANRTIFLETNSTQTPKVELNFTATVTN